MIFEGKQECSVKPLVSRRVRADSPRRSIGGITAERKDSLVGFRRRPLCVTAGSCLHDIFKEKEVWEVKILKKIVVMIKVFCKSTHGPFHVVFLYVLLQTSSIRWSRCHRCLFYRWKQVHKDKHQPTPVIDMSNAGIFFDCHWQWITFPHRIVTWDGIHSRWIQFGFSTAGFRVSEPFSVCLSVKPLRVRM